jgi:hypothetical protein
VGSSKGLVGEVEKAFAQRLGCPAGELGKSHLLTSIKLDGGDVNARYGKHRKPRDESTGELVSINCVRDAGSDEAEVAGVKTTIFDSKTGEISNCTSSLSSTAVRKALKSGMTRDMTFVEAAIPAAALEYVAQRVRKNPKQILDGEVHPRVGQFFGAGRGAQENSNQGGGFKKCVADANGAAQQTRLEGF